MTEWIYTMVAAHVFLKSDIVGQISRCTFDVHAQDIMGILIVGGSLTMLRPGGMLDLEYLATVFRNKQITYIQAVPSLLRALFSFLTETNRQTHVTSLRSLGTSGEFFQKQKLFSLFIDIHSVGEPCSVQLITLLESCITDKCQIYNLYGPAETIVCTYHHIDPRTDIRTIPIGIPMPSYHCLIVDEFGQNVIVEQEGELLMSGVGVFAGYLGRDDLTAKGLTQINGEVFYRTGDVVRMNDDGIIHYLGRKDHQVKVHGQRIELAEIEQCLLSTSISACAVTKWGDDHLVAYVQSSNVTEEELRQHCQSRLPSHMIPSLFIIMEKLPLNANGKIDRKSLPTPDFSHTSLSHLPNDMHSLSPRDEIESTIHEIWCEILQHNFISINTNIFTIGGHSLLLMQLVHRYKTNFTLQSSTLSLMDLFQHPTIAGHAEFIRQNLDARQNVEKNNAWFPLHIVQGKVNF